MLPAVLAAEFARDALLTRNGMLAVGIGTRDVTDLVGSGTIVCLARHLYVRREDESFGYPEDAIACKIGSGVLRGSPRARSTA
jgi:hypothetical protein